MGPGGSAAQPAPEQPPTAPQQQQAAEERQDCMQCRIIGASVCLAASTYLTLQHYAQPPTGRVHRAFKLAAAGGFCALGIARALL